MEKNVTKKSRFTLAKAVTAVGSVLATGAAFAADEVTTAVTASIDKSDLWGAGAVILGACGVIAMIALGRRVAR